MICPVFSLRPAWLPLCFVLWGHMTLISSCGPDDFHRKNLFPFIKHPTSEEVSSGTVKPLEYFVAWKKKSSPGNHHFSPQYREELNHYYHQRYVPSQKLHHIEVLSELLWQPNTPPTSPFLDTPWNPQSSLTKLAAPYPRAPITLVHFNSEKQARLTLSQLLAHNKIWYAEPHRQAQLQQTSDTNTDHPEPLVYAPPKPISRDDLDFATLKEAYTSKPSYPLPYHTQSLDLAQAFDILAKLPASEQERILEKAPIIAIMDSGVDIQHPAISENVMDLSADHLRGARACQGDRYGCNTTADFSKEHLGNGEVFPVGTTDFGQSCPYPSKDTSQRRHNYCRHGTHVAGLAVGLSPRQGVLGACPFCRYLPVRIVADNLNIPDSAIIRGLQYIALVQGKNKERVQVVNASFGKSHESLSVSLLIQRLVKQHDILVVAAAGNSKSMSREYPGSLQEVLAVTAVRNNNVNLHQANTGTWIGVAAPGARLRSSIPGGSTNEDSGTSMAAPLVAGVAGLVLAKAKRHLTATELRHILEDSAQTETLYEANPDYKFTNENTSKQGALGFGLIHAADALRSPLLEEPQEPKAPRIRSGGCVITAPHHKATPHPSKLLFLLMLFAPFVMIKILTFQKTS